MVVTGAGGFVGRRLMDALAGTDARTVALVGRPCHVTARRVLAGPLDASWAQEALEDADLVVHLAGALRPVESTYWTPTSSPPRPWRRRCGAAAPAGSSS